MFGASVRELCIWVINKVNSALRKAKQTFTPKSAHQNTPSKLWNHLNNPLSRKAKKRSSLNSLNVNDRNMTDKSEMDGLHVLNTVLGKIINMHRHKSISSVIKLNL